ncbi:MAG TPA: hypothetical protein VEB64_16645 [Azospirillaceae bacterium]|nr:hypothetical protein [Azospirillaceae bacterium]
MTSEVFADSIGEITVTGAIVRLDLFALSPTERDIDNNPRQVFRQRLILPIESFMSAYELMERVARELIDNGAVQRSGNAPATPARPRASPNFS